MKVGILSDTHDELERTIQAVSLLKTCDAEVLVHCGDLSIPEIVEACAILPFYFVFGNHDADVVPELKAAAEKCGAICLGWGGEFTAADKRIAVTHGHMTMDLRPLIEKNPDYLFTGHSHEQKDWYEGTTRRINPGALFRADEYSVAWLDLAADQVEFLTIDSE